MTVWRFGPIILVVTVTLLCSDIVAMGRFYGTLNATYQRRTNESSTPITGDSTGEGQFSSTTTRYGQSELLLNYEDLLFTKNSLRLATDVLARQVNDAGRWEVRPIYYLDLKSYGYAYTGSYSPYSQAFQLRLPDGTTFNSRIYYRAWRNTVTLNYNKYPSASLTYNSGHTFDRLDTRRTDTRSRNVVIESNYGIASVALRANYTQSRTTNQVTTPYTSSSFRTYNGTASYSKDFGNAGYVSTAYSLLDTRIESRATTTTVPLTSKVHSVTGFYNTRSYFGVSGSASYSGRFTRSRTNQNRVNSSDENFSGQIGYAPLKYLSFDLTKIYQIGSRPDGNHISEYLTVSSTLNRYLRRGVDTRVSWARTYFQQIDRADDTAQNQGPYSVDNIYTSVAAQPYPHTHMLADLSISRNNDDAGTARKYVVTRSVSLLLNASRRLEGRIGASYSYQGPVLSLVRSYSRNMNVGATYYPGGNINLNLTYIRTIVNSSPRLVNSTLSSYFGYSYRQALSVYVSYNRQLQEIPNQDPTMRGNKTTIRPYGVNGQIQFRLSPRATMTFGYIHSSGSGPSGSLGKSGTLQAVFNGQF